MTTMDLKGITWVGNIYQKFEAMCLEVEEIMYEDTIKYVENQVQTVSDSVRKLYSDVIQDLLPPSSMDPVKEVISDLPIQPYADVGILVKPKLGKKEKRIKVDDIEQQFSEDPKMTTDNDLDHPSTFHGLRHVDNLFPLCQGNFAKGASRGYSKGSLSKRMNLGTNKNSKRENLSANDVSQVMTSLDKDLLRASSICQLSTKNHEASFNEKARITTSKSIEVTEHDSIEESKNEVENAHKHMPDIPTNEPSSDMVNVVESGWSKGMDMRHSSSGSLLEESNDVCTNNGVVSLVEASANENLQSSKFVDEEYFESNSGDWSTDVNEGNNFIEQEMEIIQRVDKPKIEESCVMVNGDEFQFAPHGEGKSKPRKKKIRDVFSSRKRSMRKQEYEQLAVWCSNDLKSVREENAKSSVPAFTVKDTRRSPTHDFCESEWELL